MNAVDTNLLVYAHRRESRFHYQAAAALKELAEGGSPWAIPWPCIYEFFSVVTNPRIWKDTASTPAQAWSQLDAWLGSPSLRLIGETSRTLSIVGELLQRPRVRGPIVHDARIAGICLTHGVERLWTRDRDFALFPELVTADPLSQA